MGLHECAHGTPAGRQVGPSLRILTTLLTYLGLSNTHSWSSLSSAERMRQLTAGFDRLAVKNVEIARLPQNTCACSRPPFVPVR